MPKQVRVAGVKTDRGERMKKGKGWRLVGPGAKAFKATLVRRMDIGDESVAVFRVLKYPDVA
jgi:hypothetical protein